MKLDRKFESRVVLTERSESHEMHRLNQVDKFRAHRQLRRRRTQVSSSGSPRAISAVRNRPSLMCGSMSRLPDLVAENLECVSVQSAARTGVGSSWRTRRYRKYDLPEPQAEVG